MKLSSKRSKLIKVVTLMVIILIVCSCIIFYAKGYFKSNQRLIEEMKSSDPDIRLKAISRLIIRGNVAAKEPEIIDWLVNYSANLLTTYGNWTDFYKARKFYDVLKKIEPNLIVDSLTRHLFKSEIRLRILFLGIKLGIPDSEEKFINVLEKDGDRSMAEDFLNSGSSKLREGAKKWAKEHGYFVSTGSGSHRASWGKF